MRLLFNDVNHNSTVVIEIGFQHFNGNQYEFQGTKCKLTINTVKVTDGVKTVLTNHVIGMATLSKKDRFVKSKGRTISLGRAIKQVKDNVIQNLIWKAYQERTNSDKSFYYTNTVLGVVTPNIIVDGIEVTTKDFYTNVIKN